MSERILEIVVQDGFNYYNYFTEVEEYFVSRRGAPMLISPLDWALIESWKEMGIPLHIVLRGITKSFEHYSENNRGKRVNTLFYCHQEVLANFKDYVESQVGASPNSSNNGSSSTPSNSSNPDSQGSAFPKQELINFINDRRKELERAHRKATEQNYQHLQETLWRAVARLADIAGELNRANTINAESLERDLTLLEEIIFESLQQDVSAEEMEVISEEAEQQLRPHKKRMESQVYRQTLDNYIAKRLREKNFIPRLSLFYM